MESLETDVCVVGAGNAAICAALAARERGAEVTILECAPVAERSGNTRFTAGAMRVAYDGVDDIVKLVPDLSEEERRITDFGTYTTDQFFDDIARLTQYRADPDMVEILVKRSLDTLLWMRSKGVRFVPMYGRQAFKVDGRFTFWGGLAVEAWGGGPGLVEMLFAAVEKHKIDVQYETSAVSLLHDDDGVNGVRARRKGRTLEVRARAVVLASGGFEANAEWRTRYLGPGWDLAKVRGSRFNTGDGIRMGLAVGASPCGNWSGCHAVGWERNAPEFGDLAVGDAFQKHSYPLGIMVNARGERFLDEGADFRNYTYAKYGRVILEQPGQFAWQVFDAKASPLLRDEYRIRQVTKATADSLEDLVRRIDDVDRDRFLQTVREYNAAVMTDVPFNPNVKDGRGTRGLAIPKSNW
ncbi:MAG: FAD-dependent tricarballylate dehydrogenase TcuA, partial [Proteobacteria bacterium]|nr:FAD-dependent tricarballylate dehydrogenase TcuA [Pseudomonadota bacterium]